MKEIESIEEALAFIGMSGIFMSSVYEGVPVVYRGVGILFSCAIISAASSLADRKRSQVALSASPVVNPLPQNNWQAQIALPQNLGEAARVA